MKNRTFDREPNGKLFCLHDWAVAERVGLDWDLCMGIKILCRCNKCGKLKERSNNFIKEVPDELIHHGIRYF